MKQENKEWQEICSILQEATRIADLLLRDIEIRLAFQEGRYFQLKNMQLYGE